MEGLPMRPLATGKYLFYGMYCANVAVVTEA